MKTKEELDVLKEEVETLNKKLAELSEEELKQVTGGFVPKTEPVMAPQHEEIHIPGLEAIGPYAIGENDITPVHH